MLICFIFIITFYDAKAKVDINGDVSFDLVINKDLNIKTPAFIAQNTWDKNLEQESMFLKIKYLSSEEYTPKTRADSGDTLNTTASIHNSKELSVSKDIKVRSESGILVHKNQTTNYDKVKDDFSANEVTMDESISSEFETIRIEPNNQSLKMFESQALYSDTESREDTSDNYKTDKFNITPKNTINVHKSENIPEEEEHLTSEIKENLSKKPVMVTLGAVVECVYQYPKKEQLHTLLSDMTNQLAKLCVPVMQQSLQSSKRFKKRFQVVRNIDKSAFEIAFVHMVGRYKKIFTNILKDLVIGDPCENQNELKEIWKKLLKHSEEEMHRATLDCTRSFLRTRTSAEDSPIKHKMKKNLAKELTLIHAKLLETLCDKYQLCFNDLL